MRTSLDTQSLGLTEQGYRTVELYHSPGRIIKRNALFRAFLYSNGVYYYFFQEVKQLQNEIDKLSRLRHPRIVRFHGSEQKGDVIYLFLAFMTGVRVFLTHRCPLSLIRFICMRQKVEVSTNTPCHQPRPQGFSLKREKPRGRRCPAMI